MPVVRKFQFDVSFDRPVEIARELVPETPAELEPEYEPEPPEPTFSAAELEAARQQGWADGHVAGATEAHARSEQQLARAGQRLSVQLDEAQREQRSAMARIERQATDLALGVARKLFPAFAQRSGLVELEALVLDAFRDMVSEPKLVVRCSPDIRGEFDAFVRGAASDAGFEGKVSVIGDPQYSDGDCRIEWADGGVERDPHQLMELIEAAMGRGMDAFDRRLGPGGISGGTGADRANEEIVG